MEIGIAGIGGIGSNVARILAQAGVEKFLIVDFDRVETSNLNRQFYTHAQVGEKKTISLERNLKAISPGIEIRKIDRKIAPGDACALFKDCAVVVEGFDDRTSKKMILEELSGIGKVLVSASGIAGRDMETVKTRKIGSCHIVGDFVSDQEKCELFPPKIALVASLMAGIVLNQIKEMNNE